MYVQKNPHHDLEYDGVDSGDRCDAGTVEDVEHFICDCSAWDHARLQELGAVRDVADLQNRPEAILRFVRRILPAYCGVRASGSARPQSK